MEDETCSELSGLVAMFDPSSNRPIVSIGVRAVSELVRSINDQSSCLLAAVKAPVDVDIITPTWDQTTFIGEQAFQVDRCNGTDAFCVVSIRSLAFENTRGSAMIRKQTVSAENRFLDSCLVPEERALSLFHGFPSLFGTVLFSKSKCKAPNSY